MSRKVVSIARKTGQTDRRHYDDNTLRQNCRGVNNPHIFGQKDGALFVSQVNIALCFLSQVGIYQWIFAYPLKNVPY